jgi:hypothetical protein
MAKLNIKVRNNQIHFGKDGLKLSFQRTLRIPDNGCKYPLPPGLGSFPIRLVDDYADRVPEEWLERGGVFLPMYQREAMWLHFSGPSWKPRAVKVAVGKVCAITGKKWSENLRRRPQDYIVTPPQPWLDGIASGRGAIRQFVAMPLGMGYTVEGQVTGEERFGGIQIKVFEPKSGRFPDQNPYQTRMRQGHGAPMPACAPPAPLGCAGPPPQAKSVGRAQGSSMGLAAGGKMKQKIYPDPHGVGTWDPTNTGRIFVHIVNSDTWREITGEQPPTTPVSAKEYQGYGLPWYDLYDEGAAAVKGGKALGKVKSVANLDHEKFGSALQDDAHVNVKNVNKLPLPKGGVRDGDW